MNRGYAFGFAIVILVLVLGMYVAYTGFVSSREAWLARPTSPPSTEVGQIRPTVRIESTAVLTATAVLTTGLENTPSPTPLTIVVPSVEAPPTTDAPAPAATSTRIPDATDPPPPTLTATPGVQAPPTPASAPAYQFRLAGPPFPDPNLSNCCYLFGTVRDAAGNSLEGVRVQASNEWNTLPSAVTKGGGELGLYDITIGRDMVAWDVVVLDAAGNQISTKVQVQFDPNQANGIRIDWQRTY